MRVFHAYLVEHGRRERSRRERSEGQDDRAAAQESSTRALSIARIRTDASGAVDEAWPAERVALQRWAERIHIAGCNTYIARKEALRLYLSPRAEGGSSAARSFESRYLFEDQRTQFS